ncbi:uncharacterized protein A1O9_05968 [Exophiala aquamarina CBS 119918]|uniref:Uncharacterized protein n=1 Tax=Exophiala aquamarina CBS 119918 TaxID=1182545 RepID=A0A072PR84_9EURO|nr:uncharacterized protein A1O9_05968 [Exophiala aquamarina CBS 119918]KEF58045.1 hypothetical protein A1O9_05968 [Exophiala aquamarina CBS 119918]
MTVIENDIVAVQISTIKDRCIQRQEADMRLQPYDRSVVTLGAGQGTDVIVQGLSSPKGIYWIRNNATCAEARQPHALAALYYQNASPVVLPTSTASNPHSVGCDNDPIDAIAPIYPLALTDPDQTSR